MARSDSSVLRSVRRIDAPIDVVWSLTVDLERWPSITPTISSVQLLDDAPLVIGSRALVRQPMQRATVWAVDELDEPTLFVWSARVMGMSMVARHLLVSVGDGVTEQTLEIEVAGRGAGVFLRLFGGRIRRAIDTENEAFAAVAEQTAAG